MGEYYLWFNVDKRERLDPEPFDTGAKIASNVDVGNEYTDAICTLLATDWRGDRLVYLGDYRYLDGEENPTLAKLEEDCGHREPCALDEAEKIYTDVAGRFALARDKTYYDFDLPGMQKVPYEGPMDKEIVHFRYVINDTKRQYYDRRRTPVTSPFSWRGGIPESGIMRLDPLAVFLGAGEEEWGDAYLTDGLVTAMPDGIWLGDAVRVSQDPPDEGYDDISAKYHIFYDPLITEPDESILPIIESQAFKNALEKDEGDKRVDHALRLIRQSLDGVPIDLMSPLETLLSQTGAPYAEFVQDVSMIAAYGNVADELVAHLSRECRSAADAYGWLAGKLQIPRVKTPRGDEYYLAAIRGTYRIIRAKDGMDVGGGQTLRYGIERICASLVIHDYKPNDIGKDASEASILCNSLLELMESDARRAGARSIFVLVSDDDRIANRASFYKARGYREKSLSPGEELTIAINECSTKYGISRHCMEKHL